MWLKEFRVGSRCDSCKISDAFFLELLFIPGSFTCGASIRSLNMGVVLKVLVKQGPLGIHFLKGVS